MCVCVCVYHVVLLYIILYQSPSIQQFSSCGLLETISPSSFPTDNNKSQYLFRAYYMLETMSDILLTFSHAVLSTTLKNCEVDIFIKFTLWMNNLKFGMVL